MAIGKSRTFRRSAAVVSACLALALSAGCSAPGGASVKAVQAGPVPARNITQTEKPAPAPLDVEMSLIGLGVRVEFTDNLPGDYNADGRVNGMDVFPLALHFNETDGACIDGNGDGSIDGADLFLVAVWFGAAIDGYEVVSYGPDDPGSPRTETEEPLEYYGCSMRHAKTLIWQTLPRYYSVVPVLESGERGEASAPVVINDTLPPAFWYQQGLASAIAADGSVILKWNTVEDKHSEKIYINVYWDTQTPIRFEAGASHKLIDPDENEYGSTTAVIDGLENDRPYWFAVRAQDSASPPNVELNTVERRAVPTAWGRQLIDDWGEPEDQICLTLDGDDPVAAWVETTNRRVQFARRSGDTWENTTVSIEQSVPNDLDLVILPSGYAALCWERWLGQVIWAEEGPEGFELSTIYTHDDGSLRMSGIELDADGNPNLLFGAWGVDTIRHARRVEGEWLIETALGGIESTYRHLGLTYRQDGSPLLSWYDDRYNPRDNILQLYEQSGDEWSLYSEVLGVGISGGIQFVTDHGGDLATFITAYPPLGDYGDFGILRQDGALWAFEPVGMTRMYGGVSAAVDAAGNPMALYTVNKNPEIDGKRFARLVDGEWEITVIAPGWKRIGPRSLVLGPDGNPLAAMYQEDERALYLYGPGL